MSEPLTFESIQRMHQSLKRAPTMRQTFYVNIRELTPDQAESMLLATQWAPPEITIQDAPTLPRGRMYVVAEDPLETECKQALLASQQAFAEKDMKR